MVKKTTQLKTLLTSAKIEMIMEAHNGISAKIVEETGFKGIWASGLTMSAALGVRDNNEASWTQILEVLDFMSDNTEIPILVDADTGYGNFNNVRRLVNKLERCCIAGLCIEDKLFPKTNSFIGGECQPLADINEFCGKIKAAKDHQKDPDFVVIARIEALIAGWGIGEAIKRADAYANAGADAILIHSKIQNADQIISFMDLWDKKCPAVCVPTTYSETSLSVLEASGIDMAIFANHMLRSAVTQMKRHAQKIFEEQSITSVESEIVPVKEIFRLQNADELKLAENKYLPQELFAKGIILAASRGVEFEDLTKDKPKTMIKLDGKPILAKIQEAFNKCQIKDITAVVGYKPESVTINNIKKVNHVDWEKTGNLYSLYQVVDKFEGPLIISYGDIVFEDRVLRDLLDVSEDIVLSADYSWSNVPEERKMICHVVTENAPSDNFGSLTYIRLKKIGFNIKKDVSHGEWIGLIKLSSKGTEIVREQLNELFKDGNTKYLKYSLVDFIEYLLKKDKDVFVQYFRGRWVDVDNKNDLNRYNKWMNKQNEKQHTF